MPLKVADFQIFAKHAGNAAVTAPVKCPLRPFTALLVDFRGTPVSRLDFSLFAYLIG